ncbi:MAG: endospore germination permease [Desulfitobacterium sp.]
MLEGGKITAKQMVLLLFVGRSITWIAFLPVLAAPPENQDVWINCLTGFPIHLLVALPFYFLAKRFPHQTFFEYTDTILGKLGKLIGILYILFLIHNAALTINYFSEFLTTVVMLLTPPLFFKISLLLLAAYAAYKGIENLGRLSELFAPIILFTVLVVVLSLVKDMDSKEFLPLLESGVFPSSFLSGFYLASATIEIIAMAVILPFLNDCSKLKTVYLTFPLLLGVFVFIITATVIALFGDDLAKNLTYPFYNAVRLIQLGNFVERVESIHVALWVLGLSINLSLYLYVMALGASQVFQLKTYKPLLLPLVSIIIPVSAMLGKNIVELKEFTSFQIHPWFTIIFIFIIPFLLLLTAIIRKQGDYQP